MVPAGDNDFEALASQSEHPSPPRIDDPISRRTLLHRGVAAAALAALPCDSAVSAVAASAASRVDANVRVSHDRYRSTSGRRSRRTRGTHASSSSPARPRPRLPSSS